jgi:hypothetical protein
MEPLSPYKHLQQIANTVLRRERFSLRITYKGEPVYNYKPNWFKCPDAARPVPSGGRQAAAEPSQDSSDEDAGEAPIGTGIIKPEEPSPDDDRSCRDKLEEINNSGEVLPLPTSSLPAAQIRRPRPLNQEFLNALKKRLGDTPAATKYLNGLGLSAETIRWFNLGLSKPYRKVAGETQENALLYPVRAADGMFYKYGYCNIPGLTKAPADDDLWIAGPVLTYYAAAVRNQKKVFVCSGPRDLWRTWQEVVQRSYAEDLLLISSTQGSDHPEEWRDPQFWNRWEVVYFGFSGDAFDEALSGKLIKLTGREIMRVRVPERYGKSWIDFWKGGGTLAEFDRLLCEAQVVSEELKPADDSLSVGRFSYEPVDINGAFRNGHLYYTVQTLTRELTQTQGGSAGAVMQVVERLDTVVIRSDRTVHSAVWVAAPKGTRQQDRVLRLTDGTLITGEPHSSKYATWSWPSIKAFLERKSRTRSLSEILIDVLAYLKTSVWLPYEEDYAVLALTVPVTYAQAVFDSVPLLFLHGPPGSGKSQTGRAMARVCANAYVCGQTSAASIARFIDESRGFVVLDDLEAVGGKGGDFSELVQALKQSYNKETAVKLWTDVKSMRTQRINFFGVKMINNTRGAGAILKSRMLRVRTSKIPDHLREQFQESQPVETRRLDALRDELHTWTFENVVIVDAEYRRLFPKNADRAEEISAPLKVFASLAANERLSHHLEVALGRQNRESLGPDDPIRIMHDAIKNLIRDGYRHISVTHLVLEMRRILRDDYGQFSAAELPEWLKPGWVGRKLRAYDLIDTADAGVERKRVFGTNLRIYPIREGVVEEVVGWHGRQGVVVEAGPRQAGDFCRECEACTYNTLGCEIMRKRLQPRPRLNKRK